MVTTSELIKRTLRIPQVPLEMLTSDYIDWQPVPGKDSIVNQSIVRRWDAALMSVGFKLSTEAVRWFSERPYNVVPHVRALAVRTLVAVRELVGDHVQHNSYFLDFPKNVPDTVDFWVSMVRRALVPAPEFGAGYAPSDVEVRAMLATGAVNLLMLPGYGAYQHTFEELLAAHDEFIPSMKDRLTILHLGEGPVAEMQRLFTTLASTSTPPSPADRTLIADLVRQLGTYLEVNFEIPGRETKAIINAAILDDCGQVAGRVRPLVQVDTITDVLRAVDVLSGGAGTLEKSGPRLRTLRRVQRRAVMRELQLVVADKIGDVYRHREAWKRFGEGLHPHEYPAYPLAQHLFAVARGEVKIDTPMSTFERLMAESSPNTASWHLSAHAPGDFARNLDRILRSPRAVPSTILANFRRVIPKISGRVLLSMMEHFTNRRDSSLPRVFPNRKGRLFVTPDTREPLPSTIVDGVREKIENELRPRLDKVLHEGIDRLIDEHGARIRRPVVIDPEMMGVALPLSNKHTAAGLNVLPRGSIIALDRDVLRFFIYWRERTHRTDFDLSVQFFDKNFSSAGHVSWTRYHDTEGATTYSGDITEAQHGATEFIDVRLPRIPAETHYIVPQVYIYTGEDFGVTGEEPDAVAESLFGFMTLDEGQQGMPFEARAVHTKADMRGRGHVAMPMVFERHENGWRAKWVHLYRGARLGGRAEEHAEVAGLLTEAVIRRHHLTVADLVNLLPDDSVSISKGVPEGLGEPIIYLGLQQPEGLPPASRAITPNNLTDLLPE